MYNEESKSSPNESELCSFGEKYDLRDDPAKLVFVMQSDSDKSDRRKWNSEEIYYA